MGVEELSDMMFVQLKELRDNLQKTLSWDTGWLQEELYEFYTQKLPELEELRRYCNLDYAYETGYAVSGLHPEIEAEGVKLSEGVYRQYTMENVEQCKDEFIKP